MSVKVAVTRVACNVGVGNQDITTVALGGLTPKAAWFIITEATSDGVAVNHAVLGVGAATATDERWAVCGSSENAVATTDTYRRGVTDECVLIIDPSNGAVDGEADFVSFIANGVRINWGNAPGAAYLLTAILFAGTDVNGYAGTFKPHATVNNSVDITDPNFEPDFLLLAGTGYNFDDSAHGYDNLSLGIVASGGSVMQGSRTFMSVDGVATTDVQGGITASYGYCAPMGSDFRYKLEFGTFDAQGFTVTTRYGDSLNRDVGYLALEFSGYSVWAGGIDSKTSGGNQAYAGPGFPPQAVFILPTFLTGYDAWDSTGLAATLGFSAFTSAAEYCNSIQDEDSQGTSDTQSLSDDVAVNLPQDDGSAGFVASYVSMDANGFTLNFTTTDGTTRKWFAGAIGGTTTSTSTSSTTSTSTSSTSSTTSTSTSSTSLSTTTETSTSSSSTSLSTTSSLSTSTSLSTTSTSLSTTSTSLSTTSTSLSTSTSLTTSTSLSTTSTSLSTTSTSSTTTLRMIFWRHDSAGVLRTRYNVRP